MGLRSGLSGATGILSPITPPNVDVGGGNHTSGDGTGVNVGPVHAGGADAVTVTGGDKVVQQWGALAVQAGKSVTPNIPPNVLLGLIHIESRGNINAISSAQAFGLTQFIRSTADKYGVKPGDARSQVYGAAHYLHDLGYKPGNEARAIGMYNPLNGKPNTAYSNSVIAASKLYKVSGGGTAPGVNSPALDGVGDAWAAVKTLVTAIVNPSNLGRLIARAYAFFWKLIWKAIWEVVLAPIWHWCQRAVDYYFNQIMSAKKESGFYYNMAGIVTLFFWALGYGVLWGKAEDGPGLATSPRDTMLGRAVRTGQNLVAARNVVKPKDVAAKTKKKPDPVVSETPVVETRRVSVSRRRPVKVAGTDTNTDQEGAPTNADAEATDATPEGS